MVGAYGFVSPDSRDEDGVQGGELRLEATYHDIVIDASRAAGIMIPSVIS
jgi:hypothetical protein